MSLDPMVTVIVPTYNRASLIGETIESILAQTFRDFELMIVSDGCTDSTQAVVEAFGDARIKFLRQENSGGPAKPRNTGIANAKGKYIAFCDNDDLWMPAKLRKQVDLMEQQPDVALCFTGGITFGHEGFVVRRAAIKSGVDSNHFGALLYGNFIANSSVMVRRDILVAAGPFNTERTLQGAEDYEMWLRIAYKNRLARIDEQLIRYRVHQNNLGASRAASTRKAIYFLRNLGQHGIRKDILIALTWQYFKYLAYTIARR